MQLLVKACRWLLPLLLLLLLRRAAGWQRARRILYGGQVPSLLLLLLLQWQGRPVKQLRRAVAAHVAAAAELCGRGCCHGFISAAPAGNPAGLYALQLLKDLVEAGPDARVTLPAATRQKLPLKGCVRWEHWPHALLGDVVPQQCTRHTLVGMLASVQLPHEDAVRKDIRGRADVAVH